MTLALALSAAVCAGVAWVVATQRHHDDQVLLAALKASRSRDELPNTAVTKADPGHAAALPHFTSHEFAAQFNGTATEVGLPIDEVSYSLESEAGKPYLRYRVTMTVRTRYLEVRKFIAALAAAMPHVSLDSIRCGRENAAAPPLSCQLAFSAFFAKE